MALKGDRQVDAVELGFYLNETASKGVILSYSTVGSGVAMDNVNNIATVVANASGARPIGMLLTEFVNIDQSRFPINWHKDQANSGDKACIMTKGWAVTDKITGTPTIGQKAVLAVNGTVSGVAIGSSTYNEAANPLVGKFRSTKDQDGFAKVYVDL